MIPDNQIVTPNLLGYRKLELMRPKARALLANIQFPDPNQPSLENRIQFCPQIAALCNSVIDGMGAKYKVMSGIPKRKSVSRRMGYLEVLNPTSSRIRLADRNALL